MDNEIYILIIVALLALLGFLYAQLNNEKVKHKALSKENAKLIADNALLETEHLRFQLQPHTLNNLLAHLKLTANRLNKGLASLSEILEYILYKGNQHLVSIEEEVRFIEEYLRLNELFLNEIDAIKVDYSQINKNSKFYTAPCIPHLITSYFIENAFKHGNIDEKDSLRISLILTDKVFEMTVINRLKEIRTPSKGGIGLNNMKKRLELLVPNHVIKNTVTENEFQTTLTINL